MATRWSDDILIAELRDEPDLSEELTNLLGLITRDGDAKPASVVLDLREVTYCNSSNIAQLLHLRDALTKKGARLLLCCVRDAVWTLFLSTNLDRVFEVAQSKAAALASLQLSDADAVE